MSLKQSYARRSAAARPAHVTPEPVHEWSLREKLALASAVLKSGDQNWANVSRTIKSFAETPRPTDWFSTRNCAAQYNKLLETIDQPKRKRGEQETAVQAIVNKLTEQYLAYLDVELERANAKYNKKLNKIKDIESGRVSDDAVAGMYNKFMTKKARPVEVFDSESDEYTDLDDDDAEGEVESEDGTAGVVGTSSLVQGTVIGPSGASTPMEVVDVVCETPTVEARNVITTPVLSVSTTKKVHKRSPEFSEGLKHLVHSAIAGAEEQETSFRVGAPPGSPTLSMLLELPPRGHGQPLPKIPIIPSRAMPSVVASSSGSTGALSNVSGPSTIQLEFQEPFPVLPSSETPIRTSGQTSEFVSAQSEFPVPDDFLSLASDDECSKPTDLEAQLTKEELFQSNDVVPTVTVEEAGGTQDLLPVSNADSYFVSPTISPLLPMPEKGSLAPEPELVPLAKLELTELDFQDDVEISAPPPPFRPRQLTPSPRKEDSSFVTPFKASPPLIDISSPPRNQDSPIHSSPRKQEFPVPLSLTPPPKEEPPAKTPLPSPRKEDSPVKAGPSSPRKEESPLKGLVGPEDVESSEESRLGSPRRRRHQLAPTDGTSVKTDKELLVQVAKVSNPPESTDEDARPNLRSRRSAASTPTPTNPITDITPESPVKCQLPDSNFKGEVIDVLGQVTKVISTTNRTAKGEEQETSSPSEIKPLAEPVEEVELKSETEWEPEEKSNDERIGSKTPPPYKRLPAPPFPNSHNYDLTTVMGRVLQKKWEFSNYHPYKGPNKRCFTRMQWEEAAEAGCVFKSPDKIGPDGNPFCMPEGEEGEVPPFTSAFDLMADGTYRRKPVAIEVEPKSPLPVPADRSPSKSPARVEVDRSPSQSPVQVVPDRCPVPVESDGSSLKSSGTNVPTEGSPSKSPPKIGSGGSPTKSLVVPLPDETGRSPRKSVEVVPELLHVEEMLDTPEPSPGLEVKKTRKWRSGKAKVTRLQTLYHTASVFYPGDSIVESGRIPTDSPGGKRITRTRFRKEHTPGDKVKAGGSGKCSPVGTPAATPDPEPMYSDSELLPPPAPGRGLRSRQSIQPTPLDPPAPSDDSVMLTPGITLPLDVPDPKLIAKKREKKKTKKAMLALLDRVVALRACGRFVPSPKEDDLRPAAIFKNKTDLSLLMARVKMDEIESYDELVRYLNLMFVNHMILYPEDVALLQSVSSELWAVEVAPVEPLTVSNVLAVTETVQAPKGSRPRGRPRSRPSSTSSCASAQQSKPQKKEKKVPPRELRKSTVHKPEPTSSKSRKSVDPQSSRPPLPPDTPKGPPLAVKRKRGRPGLHKSPPPSPSPPPVEEAKKLRSRQSLGAQTPAQEQPRKSSGFKGKRTRAT